jgi:NodT family efflux transporter outer membrane factor (OMF) lipoprotein
VNHASVIFSRAWILCGALALGACTHSAISPEAQDPVARDAWARGGEAGAASVNWLAEFDDPSLQSLVAEALDRNYSLEQARAQLAQAEQAVVAVRANRFPQLAASLDGSRRSAEAAGGTSVVSANYSASLDLSWDVDLWGRLNKQQQAAFLSMEAQRARLRLAERALAASTVKTVFDVRLQSQLSGVADRRLDNVTQSKQVVESGYRQGLNDALDLYLARNQVERQQANLAAQRQRVLESSATLQLALARYPDGGLPAANTLPVISEGVPAGLPSELLLRRADLQQAWFNLLEADASLAVAHKARFPRLVLTGSAGVASAEFSDLLNTAGDTWSVVGGLTQPLFQAGRLAANERQARERVREVEQQYLDLVYRAFAEVENAISRDVSLRQRYASFLEAEKNSTAALELALDQYQRGLVAYTTVLESQRQAFDAEETVLQLRNELLQNRVDLFLALGGEFSTDY